MKICDNIYCQKMSISDRQILCRSCRRQDYAAGRYIEINPGDPYLMFLLDGFCVDFFYREEQRIVTSVHTTQSLPDLIFLFSTDTSPVQRTFLVHSKVLLWQKDHLQQVFNNSKQGRQFFLQMMAREYQSFQAYHQNVLAGDVKTGVTYIKELCNEKAIPPLTHEQLAFVTNHNRVTITKFLKEDLHGSNKIRK